MTTEHKDLLNEVVETCLATLKRIESGIKVNFIAEAKIGYTDEFFDLPTYYHYDKHGMYDTYKVIGVSKNDNNEIIVWCKSKDGEAPVDIRQISPDNLEVQELVDVADLVANKL